MATKTKTPEYDFDSWSEDAEEKAIAQIADTIDVRYIIVERTFIGRFTDGTIVEVPISLSLDDVDNLDGVGGPVDQFKTILTNVGGEAAAKAFTSHDIAETAVLAEKYFTILQRVTKAALPE
ncbi:MULTISPECIES: hypothetical protein [unclassified Microbacterium]|uniref:hypothetical protein n=1 Tax=unclassified Microbacterium TaxID=2609290 RepID=UPI00300FE174